MWSRALCSPRIDSIQGLLPARSAFLHPVCASEKIVLGFGCTNALLRDTGPFFNGTNRGNVNIGNIDASWWCFSEIGGGFSQNNQILQEEVSAH